MSFFFAVSTVSTMLYVHYYGVYCTLQLELCAEEMGNVMFWRWVDGWTGEIEWRCGNPPDLLETERYIRNWLLSAILARLFVTGTDIVATERKKRATDTNQVPLK
jgi:hypothetical protein